MTVRIYQGMEPQLETSVYVDDKALVIGDVSLGQDVSVWPMAVLRGDVNRIVVGAATNIQDNAVLHVTHKWDGNPEGHPLIIGKGVTIGHSVVLHGCTVGDFSLIGIGAIVLDGAVIGERVMIGAGALVTPGKRLESGYLYVGSPAKPSRPLTLAELDYLEYSRDAYVSLKNRYLADLAALIAQVPSS
jgi:carbonic anhydrase/acetyltransferase-like protein (isoleucine patch superfamily)